MPGVIACNTKRSFDSYDDILTFGEESDSEEEEDLHPSADANSDGDSFRSGSSTRSTLALDNGVSTRSTLATPTESLMGDQRSTGGLELARLSELQKQKQQRRREKEEERAARRKEKISAGLLPPEGNVTREALKLAESLYEIRNEPPPGLLISMRMNLGRVLRTPEYYVLVEKLVAEKQGIENVLATKEFIR